LDYDESVEECAVREIWEESGIDIRQYSPPHLKPMPLISSDFPTIAGTQR
jgi:8-oxo-dGTP pyrophosphatase MutT (NUDIX family)